jgi:predicted AAA+ superfamily ATPase
MNRKIEQTLKKWKTDKKYLPLMLLGARQIGKTYILEKFCKDNYNNYLYLNLAENPEYKDFFSSSINPQNIINQIDIFFNNKFDFSKNCLFIDEIQECENAISSLKYFAESHTKYNVVCAGSLLGVKINRMKTSFPVGKVRIENMYPLDFEEFLWAVNEKTLANEIKKAYASNKALSTPLHNKAINLYKNYLIIGGMPAAINSFISENKDIVSLNKRVLSDIITGYLADMIRYADNVNAIKIHQVYKSMPSQLAKPNTTKFMYKYIEQGGNSEKFQTAIDWLIQANLLLPCNLVSLPQSPLSAYLNYNIFKLYLSDTGLLVTLARLKTNEILNNQNILFRGFLTENYVAQTLASKNIDLYYWESGNKAEIDFVTNLKDGIIPIEVKASENVRSKSLSAFVNKYKPPYAIRISTKNFGFENNIKSVPLYAVWCIE